MYNFKKQVRKFQLQFDYNTNLISLRSICCKFVLSIDILPLCISTILNKTKNRLDFPEPVLPTIPIFSPGRVWKDTSFKASGNPSRYLMNTFLKQAIPAVGQTGETYNIMQPCFLKC